MYSNIDNESDTRNYTRYLSRIDKKTIYYGFISSLILMNFIFLLVIISNLGTINEIVDQKVGKFSDLSDKFSTIYDQYDADKTKLYIEKLKVIIDNICDQIEDCKSLH